jgi:hypothetical protein
MNWRAVAVAAVLLVLLGFWCYGTTRDDGP